MRTIGLSPDLYYEYRRYIRELQNSNVPVIFELEHLSQLLGRKRTFLASVINDQTYFYNTFDFVKRNGDKRIINAPYPSLLQCQKWINIFILSQYKLHDAAHGFRKKYSIKSNASQHLNQKVILKLDIKDFFPSINQKRVINIFKQFGYYNNVAYFLSRLCTLEDKLPQGAATSPYISNIIGINLDCRLTGLAAKYNLVYTRYADDLTFSGNYIPHKIIDIISSIVSSEGFELNQNKTKLSLKGSRKIVTGLSVSGESLRIPKQYKRSIRKDFYYIKKYGALSHIQKRGIKNPFYLQSLQGKIDFWLFIEPENKFALDAANYLRSI